VALFGNQKKSNGQFSEQSPHQRRPGLCSGIGAAWGDISGVWGTIQSLTRKIMAAELIQRMKRSLDAKHGKSHY